MLTDLREAEVCSELGLCSLEPLPPSQEHAQEGCRRVGYRCRTDMGEPRSVCNGIRTRDYVYRRGKRRHFLVDKNLGCEREERKRGGRGRIQNSKKLT